MDIELEIYNQTCGQLSLQNIVYTHCQALSETYQPPKTYATDYCSDCLGAHQPSAAVSW